MGLAKSRSSVISTRFSAMQAIDRLVPLARQALVLDRVCIILAGGDFDRESPVEVLVQLELHGSAVSAGSGITRSFVISAAYASAALISSIVSCG